MAWYGLVAVRQHRPKGSPLLGAEAQGVEEKEVAMARQEGASRCSECLEPKIAESDRLARMRGTCEECWASLPWQSRVRRVALATDREEAKGELDISLWATRYSELTPEVWQAIGEYPSERASDVIRIVRSFAMPLEKVPGYEYYLGSVFEFSCLYPKDWKAREDPRRALWGVVFTSPEGGSRHKYLSVRVAMKEWNGSLPTRDDVVETAKDWAIKLRFDTKEGPYPCDVDGYPAARMVHTKKVGFLFKSRLIGHITFVFSEDRIYILDGLTGIEYHSELEPIYQRFVESFRVYPEPDAEEEHYYIRRRQRFEELRKGISRKKSQTI